MLTRRRGQLGPRTVNPLSPARRPRSSHFDWATASLRRGCDALQKHLIRVNSEGARGSFKCPVYCIFITMPVAARMRLYAVVLLGCRQNEGDLVGVPST